MMFNNTFSGFTTSEERQAVIWLWGTYLRRRVPVILAITCAVVLQSLAMLAFLETMRTSINSFFSSNNGTYELNERSQKDANGDGVFDLSLKIVDTDILLNVSLKENPDDRGSENISFDPVALAEAQGISTDDRELKLVGPDAELFTFVSAQTTSALFWLVGALSLAMVLRAVCSYTATRLSAKLSIQAGLEMRVDVIQHLLSLDLAYFDVTPTGRLVHRVFSIVTQLQAFFSSQLVINANHALTILMILVYLAWLHFVLFCFAFLILPLAVMAVRYTTLRIRGLAEKTNTATASFLTLVETTLTGIRTIKLTNQSQRAAERLEESSTRIAKLGLSIARSQALVAPFVDLLAAFFFILILGFGGFAVINNWAGLDATTLITFAVALGLLFDPARVLSRFNVTLSALLVSLTEIHRMWQERGTIVEVTDAGQPLSAEGDIEFRDIKFSYSTSDLPLFNDLNLHFPGRKTSAIVGQTGSGKSTLLSLLARLYEPQQGKILIDNNDITEINSHELRNSFGVVSQEIFIFDATITENIRFVKPEASDAEVMNAATKAQLSTLISEKGPLTVGPRGAQLSGGQKQRIAIARAFLQDAPIILLDEATSALDQRTEVKVTEALKTLCDGKTTIIIAHRLSTITHADHICVLEHGKLAESGTHKQLLAKDKLYAALFKAQSNRHELLEPVE